jgi:hypothetical protein
MKSIVFSLFILALIITGSSCDRDDRDERYQQLLVDYHDLEQQITRNDSLTAEMFQTFGKIEKNLASIRAKERMINSRSLKEKELTSDVRKRIIMEIREIDDLLNSNYDRIDALNDELNRSGVKLKAYKQTVETLNEALQLREDELDTLKRRLIQMNFEVDELEYLVSSLKEQNTRTEKLAGQYSNELNKAWFAVGTPRELMDKGIVERTGGILGIGSTLVLSDDISEEDLSEINISELYELSVTGKKIKIVSNHPEESYKLHDEGSSQKLFIEDPEAFWNGSKYLVVVSKP